MKSKVASRHILVLFAAFFIAQLLAGCALIKKAPPVTKKPALRRIRTSAYPAFADNLNYDGLAHGILQSLTYLKKLPSTRQFKFGNDLYTTDHLIRSLTYFQNFIETKPPLKDLNKFITSNYRIYRSVGSNKAGNVLFTGYYEPALQGSLNKSDEYRYPVYARPDDLLTIDLSLFSSRYNDEKIIGRHTGQIVVPYYDRAQIAQNDFLEGIAAQLVWVKDQVDLFFLQIQGSGKINLDNGESINVHYHTDNGRPYRSIGKLLIEKGKVERSQMSMQKIRAYLKDHPSEVEDILNYNLSYVFFKIEKNGPLGYLEVILSPGRSIALDRRLFPPAALAFIETKLPLVNGDGEIQTWTDLTRFVLNQDTGGAIRGPGRADLFWGDGPYAEIAAGHMRHHGKLYFLVLKPDQF
ncbi:murein transglycosylase A [Thermodesulfobacteriota bacterium]